MNWIIKIKYRNPDGTFGRKYHLMKNAGSFLEVFNAIEARLTHTDIVYLSVRPTKLDSLEYRG